MGAEARFWTATPACGWDVSRLARKVNRIPTRGLAPVLTDNPKERLIRRSAAALAWSASSLAATPSSAWPVGCWQSRGTNGPTRHYFGLEILAGCR